MSILGIVLGILLFLFFLLVANIYNQSVTLKNRLKNAFSQIDVQLKRRHDLIPNLVEATKGYLKHEKETLENVISARNISEKAAREAGNHPDSAKAIKNLSGAESQLSSALGRLMVVVESYPDLKGDQTVRELTEELTSTENRISFARQAFNDSVTRYNIYIQRFPQNFISGFFQFFEAELFELENRAQYEKAPSVSL